VRCPKCRAELPDSDRECPHCGIIFTKYLEREKPLPPSSPEPTADVEDDPSSLGTLLLGVESPTPMPVGIGRGVFLLLMSIWTMTLVSRAVNVENTSGLMHLPNLVFHEAGHILFIPLGRFMTVLGGSLTQVLVPLVCAGAFLWQTRDAFGAAIAIWWAGQSLTDVAPYINDARDLQLVLLGGKTGAEVEGHDWEYLLNAMGVSHLDHTIALVVQTIGNLTMIIALVWAAIVVLNQVSSRRAEL
jgi:zinc ribbon protein